ncbi:outer membrane beta-barrel protein [Spiribacter vilamensis]|uniref:Uncharacterized protein (PEP-CTERM system associated) n=1 Tax=Spiribacter vilamensis TaxID=531306 RepID=A0A4Q8D154_9GAMM|nr:outer membrane beta-barrel protein [Spiribacter vilamensis]RZU99086.1 uncharacterized protein (PEP-CTERM system associated) [Spiribacter vilamensis]
MQRYQSGAALLAAAALLTTAGTAHAVDPMPLNQDGPFEFIPTIKVSQGYDDNVNESADGDEESSNVTKVAPSFLLRAQEQANRYQLRYTPSFQRYSHDSDENRVNHNAAATAQLTLDSRNRLGLGLTANRNQSTPGDSEGDPDEGDINERLAFNGDYTFGARGAQGQIELDGGYVWNRYANNLTGTANNQSEEYDSPRFGARFLWRASPKTQLFVEGRYADFNYTWSESRLDSENLSASVGARWQATAKTSGSFQVGRQEKSFDDATKSDEDVNSWQAQVTWSPETYSSVTLATANTLEEGSEASAGKSRENAVEQTTYSINWDYAWSGRVNTNLGYSLLEEDSVGGNLDGQSEETDTVTAGVSYSFRRWLDFGFETRFKDNSADVGDGYDRNTYFLTATLSL